MSLQASATARELWRSMQADGVQPNGMAVAAFLEILLLEGEVDEALQACTYLQGGVHGVVCGVCCLTAQALAFDVCCWCGLADKYCPCCLFGDTDCGLAATSCTCFTAKCALLHALKPCFPHAHANVCVLTTPADPGVCTAWQPWQQRRAAGATTEPLAAKEPTAGRSCRLGGGVE